ncbi:ribonuclease H-like domain-containing protein [Tanacetum coccineum]
MTQSMTQPTSHGLPPTTTTRTHHDDHSCSIGTVKPNSRFHGLTSSISPIHKSPFVALSDPHWRDAMLYEYNALIKNGTWILVSKPPNVNMVWSMWLYEHKFCADGSLNRYKARLVANGRSQQFGVYCDDTFCLVVKPATIRTVLSLALSRGWHVHQLNVKNAFLNEDLSETVIPFELFSPRVGVTRLSLFIDMVLRGMFLSQKKYAMKLLERAHMANCNPTRTLVDTESKLGCDGDPVSDPTLYCSLVGGLQYLTFTPPDISYVVQQNFLLMHDPREPHLAALKYILHYVQGTLDFGLQLYSSSSTSLVAYSDADWVGCPTTRRSTSGGLQMQLPRLPGFIIYYESYIHLFTLVYCDNASAIYLTASPVQHQQTKHIEIDFHFVHDMVARGQVRVLHVPSRYQYVDIFTKGLSSDLFEEFRASLSVRRTPALTAREC